MMRRRLPALLTCLLVLTSSASASGVCESMSRQAEQHKTHEATSSDRGLASSQSPHSHHTSDESTRYSHCQNAPSCTGIALATHGFLSVVSSDAGSIVPTVALAPVGNAPDLEPPPPKA
jgi:hypothetical protein